ncbi:MAG: threonylcarbamoyl-AMP synthase [Lachnospiraceae bacterium]|jgi:L-threonylcarbamoyladenylate synthase|nr:threonylcarbamoyl-AMP synthase [Lachnospiraceae bacterium]
MKTILGKLNGIEADRELLQQAAQIIKRGGLVAFPTETVYGLGADGFNEEAAKKIYAAKGRPSDNPLILHIAEEKQLEQIVKKIPEKAKKLMESFWPGPLTIILEKKENVPYTTTGGLDTVAIRMPNHLGALSFLKAVQTPIAAPSANTSGRPSPTKAEHVLEDMKGKIDMILDGGEVGIGIESTIIDMTSVPMILRPGFITQEMLEEKIGDVFLDPALQNGLQEKERPKAPGMKYRHYAPKADLTIVEGELSRVIDQINRLTAQKVSEGKKVGIIATEETKKFYKHGIIKVIGTRKKEETIAKHLYSILREFDEDKIDVIFSEAFSEKAFGQAIMNRLIKAAGHHRITV